MGESTWSLSLDGTVSADADAVVAWWFHPDRQAEYLEVAKSRGALDLAYTRSSEGGRSIGRLHYRTAQGWEFHHVLESNIDESGMPPKTGDRYVSETRDIETVRSGRRHFSVRCVASQEFVAVGPKETQITATHQHTMSGGSWVWRWNRRRKDYPTHRRYFDRRLGQCNQAVGQSGSNWPEG